MKGLIVVGVDVGENYTTVSKFLTEKKITFKVLLDKTSGLYDRYELIGFPTTFMIDKNGVIQDIILGAFPNKLAIEQRLAKILP